MRAVSTWRYPVARADSTAARVVLPRGVCQTPSPTRGIRAPVLSAIEAVVTFVVLMLLPSPGRRPVRGGSAARNRRRPRRTVPRSADEGDRPLARLAPHRDLDGLAGAPPEHGLAD